VGRRFWRALPVVFIVLALLYAPGRRAELPPDLVPIPIPTVSVEPVELPEPEPEGAGPLGQAIALTASWALDGLVAEAVPNYCLRLVREIVEHAAGMQPWGFYEVFLVTRVEENHTVEPWARDLERSMRLMGLAVHHPREGDIVFNYNLGGVYGHAGIMLTDELVLDVWPSASGPPLRVSHVDDWGPTTIARIPECLTVKEQAC
jgi:hypothetical protein